MTGRLATIEEEKKSSNMNSGPSTPTVAVAPPVAATATVKRDYPVKNGSAGSSSNGVSSNKRSGNSDESGFYEDENRGSSSSITANPAGPSAAAASSGAPMAVHRCPTRDDSIEIVYDRKAETCNNNNNGELATLAPVSVTPSAFSRQGRGQT